jgi:hypothetical protein
LAAGLRIRSSPADLDGLDWRLGFDPQVRLERRHEAEALVQALGSAAGRRAKPNDVAAGGTGIGDGLDD